MSYIEAKSLGITNEDLICIKPKQLKDNSYSYRIMVTRSNGNKYNDTKRNLLEAIKLKWDFLKLVEEEKKKAELEKEKKEMISNKKYDFSVLTVKEMVDIYIANKKKLVDMNVIQISTYETDICDSKRSLLIDSKILEKKVEEVIIDDSEVAQEFITFLRTSKTKSGKFYAENTIYKPFSLIHKVFEYFFKELRAITFNPFTDVMYKPKAVYSAKNYLTTEEIHLIKNALAIQNIRFKTLVNLRIDTGYRIEEALPIKYKDINRLRGTLQLGRTLIKSKIDGRLIVKENMKNKSSEREIHLTRKVLELIECMRQFKEACGFVVTDDDYVFTAWESMDLISPELYSKEWKEFVTGIGFTDLPFKNLRDSHATFFAEIEEPTNIKAVQTRLGHSRAETTTNIYFQSNLKDDKKLVEKFEKEFYNKLGLTTVELYKIVVGRFDRKNKMIDTLQKVSGEYVDDSNYDEYLENFKNELISTFPIFSKIMKIDSLLDDEEIDSLLIGVTSLYRDVNLENIIINKSIKI